jgi:mannitol/fructose-specific phosphotransferase system IIA component (Ntr-type)
MEPQFFNEQELADYLHLSLADIRQRVKFHEIPFANRGKRIVFPKSEIDSWASQRILNLPEKRLAEYHRTATAAQLPQPAILPQLIEPGFIAPALTAKTKASVLRELVSLADTTGRLNNPQILLESLLAREALCATAMPGGFALPHPQNQEPFLFESSFIVVGRPIQPINFGATDGEPTNLFFLVCCPDGQLHLHALSRICFMAQTTGLLAQIVGATDAGSICQCLIAAEQEVLAKFSR